MTVNINRDRGVNVAQAACDLRVQKTVLRKSIADFDRDPVAAFRATAR
ncbi:MAG: hypothetical protein U1E37_01465 [Sphingomonadaceae bacterium]